MTNSPWPKLFFVWRCYWEFVVVQVSSAKLAGKSTFNSLRWADFQLLFFSQQFLTLCIFLF